MPLPLPQLDDRTYEQLVAEARALIPTLAPRWTDHNASDPGIALLELFAFLTEQLIYRADQVTDESRLTFLRLLNGPKWQPQGDLDADIRAAISGLRERYRAVTADDYEQLALTNWATSPEAAALGPGAAVLRARAVSRRNFARADAQARRADAPGQISLLIVSQAQSDDALPQPSPALLAALAAWLEPRRLLGTRHTVVGPAYLPVQVRASLAALGDADLGRVRAAAAAALRGFLHPLRGGEDGRGWPFGRSLYVSEIYQLLDQLDGVDAAFDVALSSPVAGRAMASASGALLGLWLEPWELIDAQVQASDLTVQEAPR